MHSVLRYLFLLPLAIHTAWVAATWQRLPLEFGGGFTDTTTLPVFVIQWLCVTLGANLAFIAIHWRLPSGGKHLLSVPKRDWWLADPERRMQLVANLRGLVEVSLFCTNLFFLAVYQFIYQSNVPAPILFVPEKILLIAFTVLPISGNLVYIAVVFRRLVKTPDAALTTPGD
jgi:hypothetical protein